MIGGLRRKFVLCALAALVVTFGLVCAAINVGSHVLITRRADETIALLREGGGSFPETEVDADPLIDGMFRVTEETPFATRYFVASFDGRGKVDRVDDEHIASFDRLEIADVAESIVARGTERGYYGGRYRYGVFYNEQVEGGVVVVLDCYEQLQFAALLLRLSATVACACTFVALVLLVPISGRVVMPFVQNLERQRRFVTDASHELKTPLAIIAANMDVAEALSGENDWTASTKTQVRRLNRLVADLIELARAGEPASRTTLATVDFSGVASRVVADFAPLADVAGVGFESSVGDGAMVLGIESELERLCGILIDNAIKYCDAGGVVRVALSVERRIVRLGVGNPCADLRKDDLARVFDRFYRAEPSRVRTDVGRTGAEGDVPQSRRTGGYGIGLSLAQSTAEKHGGKMRAKKNGDVVWFTAVLPRAVR